MSGYDNNNDNENWSESSSYNEEDFFTESELEDEVYKKEDEEEMPPGKKLKVTKKKSDASNVPIVDNVKWTKSGFTKPNSTINLEEPKCLYSSDEMKYFRRFWTKEIMEMLVLETNRYGHQKQQDNWKDVDLLHMTKFIGILLAIGIDRQPELRSYWTTTKAGEKEKLLGNNKIKETMTVNDFQQTWRHLHVINNKEL